MAQQESNSPPRGSYWYPDGDSSTDHALEVLRALRRFRATDVGMRRRAQADMDMNETDLLAIRHLIAAEAKGKPASPTELTEVLNVSTAATAKLLARLVKSGHIRREPNPRDRRAQVLYATPNAHSEVRLTLGRTHQRMLEVAESLNADEQRAVVYFLNEISSAMDDPDDRSSDDGSPTATP